MMPSKVTIVKNTLLYTGNIAKIVNLETSHHKPKNSVTLHADGC